MSAPACPPEGGAHVPLGGTREAEGAAVSHVLSAPAPAPTVAADTPDAVQRTITVHAPQALAFEVFTAGMSRWWPMASHHIGEAPCVAVVIEPRVGGRWFERGADGRECTWGEVLAWEPPRRLRLAWRLDAQWRFDPALHTEVEVSFEALDDRRTEVHLAHRGLRAYGDQAAAMAETFASAQGWQGMLGHFAQALAA